MHSLSSLYNLGTIVSKRFTLFKASISSKCLGTHTSKETNQSRGSSASRCRLGTLGPWGSGGEGRPLRGKPRVAWTCGAQLLWRGAGERGRGAGGPGLSWVPGPVCGLRSQCFPGRTSTPGTYNTKCSTQVCSRSSSLNSPSLSTNPHHMRTSSSASSPWLCSGPPNKTDGCPCLGRAPGPWATQSL